MKRNNKDDEQTIKDLHAIMDKCWDEYSKNNTFAGYDAKSIYNILSYAVFVLEEKQISIGCGKY